MKNVSICKNTKIYSYLVTSGDNLIKLFCVNLLTLFRKLDLFIAMQQLLRILMKRPSFQKNVSKFMRKLFYETDPWLLKF